jgi:hypothetical protein
MNFLASPGCVVYIVASSPFAIEETRAVGHEIESRKSIPIPSVVALKKKF